MFSKKDLADQATRDAFQQLSGKAEMLTRLGRLLLDTALTLDTDTVFRWHQDALGLFNPDLPSRVINNLACCCVGLRALETALGRIGLEWGQVFSISMERCAEYMEQGVLEDLLEGRTIRAFCGNEDGTIWRRRAEESFCAGFSDDPAEMRRGRVH